MIVASDNGSAFLNSVTLSIIAGFPTLAGDVPPHPLEGIISRDARIEVCNLPSFHAKSRTDAFFGILTIETAALVALADKPVMAEHMFTSSVAKRRKFLVCHTCRFECTPRV